MELTTEQSTRLKPYVLAGWPGDQAFFLAGIDSTMTLRWANPDDVPLALQPEWVQRMRREAKREFDIDAAL